MPCTRLSHTVCFLSKKQTVFNLCGYNHFIGVEQSGSSLDSVNCHRQNLKTRVQIPAPVFHSPYARSHLFFCRRIGFFWNNQIISFSIKGLYSVSNNLKIQIWNLRPINQTRVMPKQHLNVMPGNFGQLNGVHAAF